MNPSVPQSVIDDAYEEDPASASAEYGAQWRSDIEGDISKEVVDSVMIEGRFELPYVSTNSYLAFVDPSGGSSDSMCLAIGHFDEATKKGVFDCLREIRAPFSPADAVEEFCDVLAVYHVRSVTGDRYGGVFCREPFREQMVAYELSERSKSDLYRDFLPLANSGAVELLDSVRLATQLVSLERRTSRGVRLDPLVD
jgi:hypothetical protein